MSQAREAALNQWAVAALGRQGLEVPASFVLTRASDDASFRRYFRAEVNGRRYIFVDAPPELEDSRPFIDVSDRLVSHGLHAPRVHEADLERGFMMLSDLGDRLYLDAVVAGDERTVERLYDHAVSALIAMQKIPVDGLPPYDESRLRQEMNLFPDWFLDHQLALETDAGERRMLEAVFAEMVANALAQPVVFVHRDYHSRNLMVRSGESPGILDFQDAVAGPVTYDLVSLLRDCYLRFRREYVYRRVDEFRERLVDEALLAPDLSRDEFRRWFDLMGLQRHLKCAGIFSRLHLRDGKARYLDDIPLVVDYMVEVCDQYDELARFGAWLSRRIVPALTARAGA